MSYEYSKLKGRIVEKCGNQQNFAKLMGLSERTVSLKLNNERKFTQPDIDKALTILEIPIEEIKDYFFTPKVQN
ncbi:DUF739 family protein [Massilimicrobiota timonensis]|uniref:DUF739 domain-containing protein n=1 Tax=Massilimicrobiota timonensis TaxID=1776392 RepID=A0A1Y4SQ86_9FIRM|nr:DUF739 family protein [Massilimicrobiota timonensis]OUQ32056.1 DUF739 domain-containing protein [Massilimicrobiota timonensis]